MLLLRRWERCRITLTLVGLTLCTACSGSGSGTKADGGGGEADGATSLIDGGAEAGSSTDGGVIADADLLRSGLLPLRDQLQNLSVSTSEQTVVRNVEIASYGVSPFDDGLAALVIDTATSLPQLHYVPADGYSGEGSLQAWVRIGGPNDSATVCQTGECWGLFSMASDASGGLSAVTPAQVEASPHAMALVTNGSFTLCFGVKAPAPGTLSADAVAVRYRLGDGPCTVAPADIAGIWSSTFSCDDSCSGSTGPQTKELVITQDAADRSKAAYTDSEGGSYSGTICGGSFTFSGGGPGWTESGTLVLNDDGTATKTSQYSTDETCCTASCSDHLVRKP